MNLQPGRYPLAGLREQDRFIASIKYLIDADWLTDVEFSNDYQFLIKKEPWKPYKPIERPLRSVVRS